jgi:hypothetical protein
VCKFPVEFVLEDVVALGDGDTILDVDLREVFEQFDAINTAGNWPKDMPGIWEFKILLADKIHRLIGESRKIKVGKPVTLVINSPNADVEIFYIGRDKGKPVYWRYDIQEIA